VRRRLGSPPLLQPEIQNVAVVKRTVQRIGRIPLRVLRIFQKKKRAVGRRQRRVRPALRASCWLCGPRRLLGFARSWATVVGLTEVMVLMVAMAVWGEPARVMLEGRSEQVA
jgi:hypothetical protein